MEQIFATQEDIIEHKEMLAVLIAKVENKTDGNFVSKLQTKQISLER